MNAKLSRAEWDELFRRELKWLARKMLKKLKKLEGKND